MCGISYGRTACIQRSKMFEHQRICLGKGEDLLFLQEADGSHQFLPAANFDKHGQGLAQGMAPLAELLPADGACTCRHVQVFQAVIVIDVKVPCEGAHFFVPIYHGGAGYLCVGDVKADPEAGMIPETFGQFCQQTGGVVKHIFHIDCQGRVVLEQFAPVFLVPFYPALLIGAQGEVCDIVGVKDNGSQPHFLCDIHALAHPVIACPEDQGILAIDADI